MPLIPGEAIKSFSYIFLIGAIFGFFDDVFRSTLFYAIPKRKEKSTLKWAVLSVYDVIFLLSYTLLFILVLYYGNNGAFRGIYLFSLYVGYVAYRAILGKTVTKIVNSVLRYISEFVIKPTLATMKDCFLFLFITIANFSKKEYNKLKPKKKRNKI